MANLPNNNEFALAAEAAPDNMNGWVEEEDPEMEEEEEDPEEDPEMEKKKKRWKLMNNGTAQNGYSLSGGGPTLYPVRHLKRNSEAEAEAEDEAEAELHPIPTLLFDGIIIICSAACCLQGVQHIEEEDVLADNKRLKMMLDCSEHRTRDA
ncbi:hypothetical protein Tco_0019069 [Tanacetum coccineum]